MAEFNIMSDELAGCLINFRFDNALEYIDDSTPAEHGALIEALARKFKDRGWYKDDGWENVIAGAVQSLGERIVDAFGLGALTGLIPGDVKINNPGLKQALIDWRFKDAENIMSDDSLHEQQYKIIQELAQLFGNSNGAEDEDTKTIVNAALRFLGVWLEESEIRLDHPPTYKPDVSVRIHIVKPETNDET